MGALGPRIRLPTWIGLALTLLLSPSALGQAPPAFAESDPSADFANAENVFRYQDYERAVLLLRPLLYPEVRLTSAEQRLRAREYLAASHWWLDQRVQAKEEFTALLLEHADHKLDPFYYPAPMVAFLNDLRRKLKASGQLEPPQPKTPEVVPVETPWAVNLLPFGVPQLTHGRPTRGWLMLFGQGLALGTSLVSAGIVEGMRGSDGLFDAGDVGTARGLRTTWWISGGLFAALYVAGVVDGFILHQAPSPAAPGGRASFSQSLR